VSFRVLVILEDYRKDRYMVEPILEKMMDEIGGPAKIQICMKPHLTGVSQVLTWARLEEVFDLHKMVDLFVLAVDRDAEEGRVIRLTELEKQAKESGRNLIAENAWQEIEVWLLAGMKDFNATWSEVRESRDPKEQYYIPYAQGRKVFSGPGEGRKILGREAASNYRRIRSKCPEDVERLEQRLKAWKQ